MKQQWVYYINPFKSHEDKAAWEPFMFNVKHELWLLGKKGKVSTEAFHCLAHIQLFQKCHWRWKYRRLIERVRMGDWNPMTRWQIRRSWDDVLCQPSFPQTQWDCSVRACDLYSICDSHVVHSEVYRGSVILKQNKHKLFLHRWKNTSCCIVCWFIT